MDVDSKKNDRSVDIGSLLVEARDNLGLTSKDIAESLNLADEVIDKIEDNNFEQDIPAAFIRGYIKSYATKVGLDTSPMLNEFDRQTGIRSPSLKSVQSISSFDNKRKEINSGHYLFKAVSILIVIVFLSFAGWKLWERLKIDARASGEVQYSYGELGSDINLQLDTISDVTQVQNTSQTEMGEQEVASPYGEKINNSIQNSNTTPDSNNNITDPVTGALSNNSFPQLSGDLDIVKTNLVLDFTADCWVKIVDARGEILAEGVKTSGKHMPLKGAVPITVILGDPSAVTMTFADETVDLSVYRAGRRAKIVLN